MPDGAGGEDIIGVAHHLCAPRAAILAGNVDQRAANRSWQPGNDCILWSQHVLNAISDSVDLREIADRALVERERRYPNPLAAHESGGGFDRIHGFCASKNNDGVEHL